MDFPWSPRIRKLFTSWCASHAATLTRARVIQCVLCLRHCLIAGYVFKSQNLNTKFVVGIWSCMQMYSGEYLLMTTYPISALHEDRIHARKAIGTFAQAFNASSTSSIGTPIRTFTSAPESCRCPGAICQQPPLSQWGWEQADAWRDEMFENPVTSFWHIDSVSLMLDTNRSTCEWDGNEQLRSQCFL